VTAGPARGGYYDGRSSKRHDVQVELSGRVLRVRGPGVDLSVPLEAIRAEEPVAHAPRMLHLPDGGLIECADLAGMDGLLRQGGRRDSLVVALQRSWRAALASVLIAIAAAAVLYVWGLPWIGDRIAEAIPREWVAGLGREAARSIDGPFFKASELSAAKREEIRGAFAAMLARSGQAAPRLEFRRFAAGPNAFALPGDLIVVTDEIVKAAEKTSDPMAALLGVLGHEYGHVRHAHPLRQFVRATVLSALVAWWIGDFSSVLATAAPVLLAARYSRDFEREADREAASLLKAAGRPVEPLVQLFEIMDRAHDAKDEPRKRSEAGDYFSTHPGTAERIRILRGQ